MFERFTDRARKVMALANQEAQHFNHEYIGTEHILLGLVKEGAGVGANVLKNLNVDLGKVRHEVEKLVKHEPEIAAVGRLPQTPQAKKAIEYAIEEARKLNHNYVGTEHLLLGLLREQDAVADKVLMNLGLKLEAVREEVLNLLGVSAARTVPSQGSNEHIQCAIEHLESAKDSAAAEGNHSRAAKVLEQVKHLRSILGETPNVPGKQECP